MINHIKSTHLILAVLLFSSSCEGYYRITGSVYQKDGITKNALDSVRIKLYRGENWPNGSAVTNAKGEYMVSGLTSPKKGVFYIIFEKTGFKTDTVEIKGNRGKTIISLDEIMVRNNIQ